MTIRERIIDYSDHKDEIEKWLRVKGDEKYSQFADMLESTGFPITWSNVSQLYRYDKRLLFNNFKYLSFFEEYARAIIVNNSNYPGQDYIALQEKGTFGNIPDQLLKLEDEILDKYFDSKDRIVALNAVNQLRRAVAHNKIILQIKDCEKTMKDFRSALPQDYRRQYTKHINECSNHIIIPEKYRITLD